MGRAYWDFAFANKEYYQLMFGLGIPGCDAASKIPAMTAFKDLVISSIVAMVAPGKTPTFDPFLKYQSFWSMLHGLVSINMSSYGHADKDGHQHPGLSQAVLEDGLCNFIHGISAAEKSRPD
jgi:hypothetical protein